MFLYEAEEKKCINDLFSMIEKKKNEELQRAFNSQNSENSKV